MIVQIDCAKSTMVVASAALFISTCLFAFGAASEDDGAPPSIGNGSAGTQEGFNELTETGRYTEALIAARNHLNAMETDHGRVSLEVARACDMVAEAMWRSGRAGNPEALNHSRRAVTIKKALLEPDDQELAVSYVEMARVLEFVGQPRDGLERLERAVAIHEAANTLDTAHGIRALTELGRMHRVFANYEQAHYGLQQAAELATANFGTSHPLTAGTWHEMGCLFFDVDRYEDARHLFEKSLATRERALGANHPLVVETLNKLGWTCRVMEDTDTARLLLERSLETGSRLLGSNHPTVVETLDSLGMLYWYLGVGKEIDAYDRARPTIEAASRDGFWKAGVWLGHESGVVWWNQRQDFLTAIRKSRAASELIERTLGASHPRLAWALKGLCGGLQATGQEVAAAPCFERRNAVLRAILERGNAPPRLEIEGLMIEAGRLEGEGRLREARDVVRETLRIQTRVYGPFNNNVAWSNYHIAGLSQALGEYEEAHRMYEEARLSWEGAWGYRPWTPVFLARSSLAEATGDLEEARIQYDLAMKATFDSLWPAHPARGPMWVGYANFLLRVGEIDESFNAALEGERRIRPHLRHTIPTLSEREGLRYAAAWASGLDVLFSVAASEPRPDFARPAHDTLIRSRALVLDEIATRQQLAWGAGDTAILEVAEQLSQARGHLANLMVKGPDSDDPDAQWQLVEQARREKEAVERELSNRSRTFRARQQAAIADLQSIQEALRPGEALVSYARYTQKPIGSAPNPGEKRAEPAPAYIAFVLEGKKASAVPLGYAFEIDAHVKALRNRISMMARSGGRSDVREERLYRESGQALRALIWDPISSHLRNASRVFVVPDGALNFVNLQALPVKSSDFLIDSGRIIHYLAAERDLFSGDESPLGHGLLALGDPAFDKRRPIVKRSEPKGELLLAARDDLQTRQRTFRGNRSTCDAFSTMRFDRLPSSAVEVKEVAAFWAGNRVVEGKPEKVSDVAFLVGGSASETEFKTSAPGNRVLHLATHGFFLGDGCPSTMDRSDNMGFDGLPDSIAGEHPLLLSGLVLAGANHREHSGPNEDDGILTAEEIASLDLSGVEWAVLSACNTGVGEARAGEGVFGLRRAFQIAGARTLIMSLWPVEDEASRRWMEALYRYRFEDGLSTIEAVHRASAGLLQDRRTKGESTHPFFWAGFIASGDWR